MDTRAKVELIPDEAVDTVTNQNIVDVDTSYSVQTMAVNIDQRINLFRRYIKNDIIGPVLVGDPPEGVSLSLIFQRG